MPSIDPSVITRRLNMHPSSKPVRQKKRVFAPCKVMIYNYVLFWLYSMTKSVVIALILFLVFCGILLYWV